jgi:hypothetical protein
MDDAGARQRSQRRRVMQQSVQQGPIRISAARVHDQPGRLVDDQNMLVLVHGRQRDRLWRERAHLGVRCDVHLDPLAAPYFVLGRGTDTVDQHERALHPVLQTAARVVRKQPRQSLIEPKSAQFGRYAQIDGPPAGVGKGLGSGLSAIIRCVFFENPHAK